jgi:uncharacterized protein YcnI
MRKERSMRKTGIIAAATLAVTLLATAAQAHVTVQPEEAPAGAFFKFVVRVPNERDDAATTKVRVMFPENLIFTSFQPKEGWEREVKMKKLDEPIEAFGAQIDEVVGSVTWSGGTIAPGEFDEFGFSVRVPEEPGELEFSAFQTYSSGEVVRWVGAPDSEEPAALVDVIALEAEEGEGELAILAHVHEQVDELAAAPAHTAAPEAEAIDDDVEDDDDKGVLLGGIGIGLGAIALLVALFKKRA